MKVLLRLLGYTRRYWVTLAAGFVSMVVGLGSSLVVPFIVQTVIDRAIARGDVGLLGAAAGGVVAVVLFRGLFAFGERYSMEYLAQKVIYDLRNALYDHLQRLSFSFYDHAVTGQLMSRVTGDVETLRRFLGFGLINLVSNVLTLSAVLVVLFSLHWRLALVSLVTAPPAAVIVATFSRRVRPKYLAIQQQLAAITTRLQENLSGVRVVRAFAREEDEEERFDSENLGYLRRHLEAVRLWAFFFPLMNFITGAGTALLIWYGGREVILGRLSLGSLVAFNSFLLMLIMPLRMLGWIVNLSQRAQAAGQRIFEILDTEPEVKDLPGARPLGRVRGEVVFENVSFSYGGPPVAWLARAGEGTGGRRTSADGGTRREAPVVHDINLRVRPGETVALLGATGSGKSTLVSLIPRFYDPTAGRVLIDGTDVREVTLESLRRQIGVVLQDTFLFSASIRENIAYGRPEATLEEVRRAARAAEIDDFIMTLPQGYDTVVGERGVGLSGGQKQRVAIARALLMDPRILILDDSTSSVDTETEQAIQRALARLMKGRTTFVIAQRLTTLRQADRIVVLERGRIVDEGGHDELLARSRIYREIYELQFRPQEEERCRAWARAGAACGLDGTGGER
ncbi:MAG TPA: ABC transporter ATP-binding protein [Clostridiales bacterium]|nr:ABC transporter ATP-binding protein [Clostridiales bacterium]